MKVSSIIILKWKFTLFNDWFVIITQIFDKPYILVFYILFNIISKIGKKYLLIHTHWNTFKLLSMKGWRGGGKYWEEGMEAVYLRDILWCERLSLEFCVSLFPCNLSTHFSPVFQPLRTVPLSAHCWAASLNTSHTESRKIRTERGKKFH